MARGNFGERLKREREMREVSLDEITAATRISTRFLNALENEDWDKLPGGVFNRGFVRAAARYLGLDEEDLLAEYDVLYAQRGALEPAPPPPAQTSVLVSRLLPALTVLLVLTVLSVGGFFGWRRLRALHRTPEAPSVSAPAPFTAPPSDVASAPFTTPPGSADLSNPLRLSISASQPVRVRVIADGKDVFDSDLASGETRSFGAQDEFVVSAGNSTAVLLELNGQAMPPIGAPESSGKIVLTRKDLKHAPDGTSQR